MSFLEVNNLTKTYRGEHKPVVSNLSFTLERGKILVLLGASGCGKTTILKMIAGLEEQDSGTISIDGAPMEGVAPEKRPISMVFQKALLFRNMTVEQNVNFAPRVNRTMKKPELARRTQEMLDLVGLSGMGKKKATELSGGQEQRVSLARALMVQPKLLLLDEPLSALDASLRENMQAYIRKLNRETGTTMIMVTHDQHEAIALADTVAVMHDGDILQQGAPTDFYAHPKTHYVASFFGWKNFVPACKEGGAVRCALGTFSVPGLEEAPQEGLLAIRPEAAVNVGSGAIIGRVAAAVYQGMDIVYELNCEGRSLHMRLPARYGFAVGDDIAFDLDPRHLWLVSDDGSAADDASAEHNERGTV